jgi:hypothetical protein
VITEEEKREREIRRKLDELVGTDFDTPHAAGFGAWLKSRWIKWALGVVLAVAMMLLIVYTIESHRLPPNPVPPARKPVPVQIIPAR